MQKDVKEKRLEEWNDVFADIFNNLVFGGREVLKEEDLVPLPTESFSRNHDGTVRQGNRDVRKADRRNGCYRLICASENQESIDNTMPQRIMGYEYASYEEQIRELMHENVQKGKPAYTKRIHDDQKLAPVVTVVLYWGTEEWKTPQALHDMLTYPEGFEDTIKPYVADYPMNLIQLSKLPEEARKRLKSDFRLIADYVACRKEPEKLKKLMTEQDQPIRHPEEFLDVLSEVAGNSHFKEMKKHMSKEKKEGGISMRTALDVLMDEKWEEGWNACKQDILSTRICKKLRKGKQPALIAEELEEDLPLIQEICMVAAAFAPGFEESKVCEAWKNHVKQQA